MLQFDSAALKEPYVFSVTQNTSTEIISEPCNMETSKGNTLRARCFAKQKENRACDFVSFSNLNFILLTFVNQVADNFMF